MQETEYKLTAYSRGAGCGCKISPQVLKEIVAASGNSRAYQSLLVGNESNDDAAVYDLGNGQGLVATTDFFMPVVDDAFDFGRVAAANAISDVYAMGGRPVLALAILGWPVDKIPASVAAKVVEGAKKVCEETGIPLAGGHTIDSTEPIFGLCVNGLVKLEHLKKNTGAQTGDLLFLTKPLGSGILSTAQKRGLISDEDRKAWLGQLLAVNRVGEKLGALKGVHAMTDVTGFGLLGHLIEMASGSGVRAEISYTALRKMQGVDNYLSQNTIPDATYRNWNAYQKQVAFESDVPMPEAFQLLPDPQTNGGLLFAVDPAAEKEVRALLQSEKLHEHAAPIGRFTDPAEVVVSVLA
jgi:selenide, water dikinase